MFQSEVRNTALLSPSVVPERLKEEWLVLLAGRATHGFFTKCGRHCWAGTFSSVPLSRCRLTHPESNENQGNSGKLFSSIQVLQGLLIGCESDSVDS